MMKRTCQKFFCLSRTLRPLNNIQKAKYALPWRVQRSKEEQALNIEDKTRTKIQKEMVDFLSAKPSEKVPLEIVPLARRILTKEDFLNITFEAYTQGAKLSYFGYRIGYNILKKPVHVAVTGAAGQIGYSLLFRIASGEMLGPDQPVILHLIEIPDEKALNAAKGVKMELQDCAFPLLKDIIITSDLAEGFKDVEYALLVGAKPRGPGMERKDLLNENAKIFAEQGKAINDYANKNCLTLVVGNPANTNCLIAASNAPNFAPEQFSAMTRLDHDRAIAMFAKHQKLPVRSVKNVFIWGNHSSTQVPDITNVEVDGKRLDSDEKFQNEILPWAFSEFIPAVQQRGAEIIKARGVSSAASAADAAIKHMRDWALGSDEIVSMAVVSDGSYGVNRGIYSSFPVRCKGKGKYEIVKNLTLNPEIKQRLDVSVNELLSERNAVKRMLARQIDNVVKTSAEEEQDYSERQPEERQNDQRRPRRGGYRRRQQ